MRQRSVHNFAIESGIAQCLYIAVNIACNGAYCDWLI